MTGRDDEAAGWHGGDRGVVRWILCAILLCFVTILVLGQLPRTTALSEPHQVLLRPDASGLPRGWQIDGEVTVADGVLRLQGTEGSPNAMARLVLPISPGELALRVALEVRVSDVRPGLSPWERARVHLAGRDDAGRTLATRSDDLVRLAGSGDWERHQGILLLPPGAQDGLLVVRLQKASGILEVRDLRLEAMGEWLVYSAASWATAAAWVVLLLWGAGLVQARVRGTSLAVLAVVAIGGGALLLAPHEWRQALLQEGAKLAGWRVGTEMVAKMGHFVIFGGLAFLARLLAPKVPAGLQLALLVLVAGIGEVLQFLAVDRSPALKDWAINSGGVLTGFVAGSIVLMLWQLAARLGRGRVVEEG